MKMNKQRYGVAGVPLCNCSPSCRWPRGKCPNGPLVFGQRLLVADTRGHMQKRGDALGMLDATCACHGLHECPGLTHGDAVLRASLLQRARQEMVAYAGAAGVQGAVFYALDRSGAVRAMSERPLATWAAVTEPTPQFPNYGENYDTAFLRTDGLAGVWGTGMRFAAGGPNERGSMSSFVEKKRFKTAQEAMVFADQHCPRQAHDPLPDGWSRALHTNGVTAAWVHGDRIRVEAAAPTAFPQHAEDFFAIRDNRTMDGRRAGCWFTSRAAAMEWALSDGDGYEEEEDEDLE